MQDTFATANEIPGTFNDMSGRKSVDPRIRDAVMYFFRALCERHFRNTSPSARARYRQSDIAKELDISATHVSELLGGTRDPGLNFVLALARLTGAPFEEILGVLPARSPRYPMANLKPDTGVAQTAASVANHHAHDRSSSTFRSATRKPPKAR